MIGVLDKEECGLRAVFTDEFGPGPSVLPDDGFHARSVVRINRTHPRQHRCVRLLDAFLDQLLSDGLIVLDSVEQFLTESGIGWRVALLRLRAIAEHKKAANHERI